MYNTGFGKIMNNVRKHKDIKLVTTKSRRNFLVSGPNYPARKKFSDNVLAIEMKSTQMLLNKPVYLGISTLEISEIVMCEF